MKANPYFALYTNFDTESGQCLHAGWDQKEFILVRMKSQGDGSLGLPVLVVEEGVSKFYFENELTTEYDGNLRDDLCQLNVKSFFLEVSVQHPRDVVKASDDIFMNLLGTFKNSESPLGAWFDESRDEVLAKEAREKMTDDGWHNHLISLLDAPFSVDLLQGRPEGLLKVPEFVLSIDKRAFTL